ncbi:MAG: ABC transporter substrate-binding protein [Desulfobacterales bacterium]|nr:ABC transporter substrate-binding protein [Desulfobacterales bacterium]
MPHINRRLFWCMLIVGMMFTSTGFASIEEQVLQKSKEAQNRLETQVIEVLTIVQNKELAADPLHYEQVLYDKALEIFDFNTFSMLALGRKYRTFSPSQKQDFVHYFSKLISKTYFPKLAGQDLDNIVVNILSARGLKPKKGIFRTQVFTELIQGDTRIPITYSMIQRDTSDWKIYDVKIEGVSMAANYMEQYRQQISLTPDEIITQLKEKVGQ